MSATTPTVDRETLRGLFLLASLADEQLDWLAARGSPVACPAGAWVYREGADAECLYLLLTGEVSMTRRVGDDDIEVIRSAQRGVYAGATQAFLGDRIQQVYVNSLRAVTDVELFAIDAGHFADAIRTWFPMALHLLEGLFIGMRTSEALVGQRERLVALGSLSAGLTHELNNPAAAAVRATSALRERIAGMRHKLALLAGGHIDPAQLTVLTALQESAVGRCHTGLVLSPVQISDLEDELADWLADAGVGTGADDLAAVFVGGGLDVAWAEQVREAVSPGFLEGALRWLAYTVETETLMSEIEDATTRVSTLVGAAKQYSQLDRAPLQVIDIHDGLDSTLIMLGGKIGPGVTIVKDYDRSLPTIPVFAAELNQVWTNVIDNALGAVAGQGSVTLRTARDGDQVLVEIGDTGPGVPESIRRRIFDPFFTTKGVGQGTGLGLDISRRIVVDKHHGDLRVVSVPGDTRFQVRLPLEGILGPPA